MGDAESITSQEDRFPLSPSGHRVHDFSFEIFPPKPPLAHAFSAETIDLAPADDIFLHGHLLPLHLLSNPHDSARSSSISISRVSSDLCINHRTIPLSNSSNNNGPEVRSKERERRPKKPMPSFPWIGKWKKGHDCDEKAAKKKGLDFGHLMKRYVSMLEHVFTSRHEKQRRQDISGRPHSFSGHPNPKDRERWPTRRRRPQLSAPASLRTSPANSGHLCVKSMNLMSSQDSSMEELQNAIQAAIMHCKNSAAAAAAKAEKRTVNC